MAPPVLKLSHNPASRPSRNSPLVSAYDLAKVAFFFVGVPRNGFGSIDVTSRCNLRCKHCYFLEQDRPDELSIDQWVEKLQELRRTRSRFEFPFFNCSWVGGEPLLRKDLIERCLPFFRYNTIVTNGTIPIPDWKLDWFVSIDGDEETHELLRDKKGCYQRAMKHVRERAYLDITIAFCISKLNVHCIEQTVKDWYEVGARNITFDFYTPIQGVDDRDLWIGFDERDKVLDQLIALSHIYGEFFAVQDKVFRLMKSDVCHEVTSNCQLFSRSFAFDAAGRDKGKCVMGEKADCSRCGCVVPYYLRSITDRRLILEDLGSRVIRRTRQAIEGRRDAP